LTRRPKPGPLLDAAFRRAQEHKREYEFLESGIRACLENVDSLAMEFSCLASHGFNARAQFVMATAMEELGKALILFDFVRIPWDRKEWIAGLCAAFYNHLKKAAYAKTVYFPGSGALADALVLFKLELIEYWPNRDPESGEPDEFADGLVSREWGLYVDWSDFDGRWFSPITSSLAYYYAQEEGRADQKVGEERIKSVLCQLAKASHEGLFTAEALRTVHSVMSRIHITFNTDETEITGALEQVAQKLIEITIELSNETLCSNFMCYPLYSAILTPEQIKGYWER